MLNNLNYKPDIAIHPGETLKDLLNSLSLKQVDLAKRTGLTPKTINKIINGKNPITPDTAIKLSVVFGMSASFWNNLEKNYRETFIRLKAEENLNKELVLLEKFNCYSELVKWKYIDKTRVKKEKVLNLLNFFGVSSLKLVPKIYPAAFMSFRKSQHEGKKGLNQESLAAWLRCGEIKARKINTEKFDNDKLIDSINELKELTKEEPESFQQKLIKICSSFGVAVTFIPYFENTYIYGATRWINPDKAMIQLSLRGKWSDIFWFSFFHELGHLLKHRKKEEFIKFTNEYKNNNQETIDEEQEADKFAMEALIPKIEYQKFIEHIKRHNLFNNRIALNTIINRFADRLNISPGIVAGRLGKEYGVWNKVSHLRTRLKFKED